MKKLLTALIAGAFAAVTFGALAADLSQKPPSNPKPAVKTGGDTAKPGRQADEPAAPPAKKSKKKKKNATPPADQPAK